MNCKRCDVWTEMPDSQGLCRGCHDYANCRYPTDRDWRAEAEWTAAVNKAKTERLDSYILTIGSICKTIDMWRSKATASGDAMVQVFEAIDRLDETWAEPVAPGTSAGTDDVTDHAPGRGAQVPGTCSDPSCGAPCDECWKRGKGRPVHASNMPSVVDLLEGEVERLRAVLVEYADHARDSGWINLADEIRQRIGATHPQRDVK